MKDDKADFLDALTSDNAPAAEPEASSQPAQEQPATSGRPRNPDGTFASTKAETDAAEQLATGGKPQPAPQPEETGAAPPAAHEDNDLIPKSVVLALRKELQELKASLKAPQQSQAQPQPQRPPEPEVPEYDFEEDPANYLRTNLEATRDAQLHQHLNFSEMIARSQLGDGPVDEAYQSFQAFAQSSPNAQATWQQIIQSRHPYDELVKWHRKHRDYEQLDQAGGLEKLLEAKLAELQARPPAAQAPPTAVPLAPKPAAPGLPSLAKGGAGAVNAPEIITEDQAFERLFDKSKRNRSKR